MTVSLPPTDSRANWAPGYQRWYPRRMVRKTVYKTCGVRVLFDVDDYSGFAELWTEWEA